MLQTDIFQHLDQLTPDMLAKAIAHDLVLLGPLVLVLAFVRVILFAGLNAGAVGSAYRGVVPAAAVE